MLKSHDKFHSANGKRLILIVDDEPINRELLGATLESDYELIFAEDGLRALEQIREHRDTLSLVLLDLQMPVLPGIEVLREIKADPSICQIPVIVMTADQNAEIECLGLGAIDFIPKPYPQTGVILARVLRTIELSEDRQIINSTERDPLTGLYNREYFYRYAEQFDQHHKELDMDAVVVDVNHFRMINERYGKVYADGVLRRISDRLRELVRDSGGIVCRREADTFMVYCPHRGDYKAILDSASVGLGGDDSSANRVRLRMGVYANVDKALDIERRFDRAKNASDSARGFTRPIGYYDNTLHEKELYAEQLVEEFQTAITEEQFVVYFQPKFDVRPDIPILASAEALVRWVHPTLGMISPGVFIPLFEENGLIQQLDNYVWRKAAAQIKDWKERFGIAVPVSVNVSRVDMYDPRLVETFQGLIAEFGLTTRELLLEITESAYTQDSEQIISIVNSLRKLGFRIEMDDFGTGYSSLNMISSLPIDALKLDMKFIRDAFRDGRDTRLIEIIIDIADYLDVPVIAEGVETEEQLTALRAMGCDIVQGYYFSRPLPASEYEQFVAERRQWAEELLDAVAPREARPELKTYTSIAHALTGGFECIYYVDAVTGHFVQFSSHGRYEDLQIERSGADFFTETQKSLLRDAFPEDLPRVSRAMQKDVLLAELAGGRFFTLTYRLMVDGAPTFYSLRAVSARDKQHIVIAVSNVEDEIRQAIGAESVHQKTFRFFNIAQALSSDFESIYYVDTDTDGYLEFSARKGEEELHVELSGTDFFNQCQKNIPTVVFREDQGRLAELFQKETLLQSLTGGQALTALFRRMVNGVPTYYRMKLVRVEGARHIVIGVSNVDVQIRRERELAMAQERIKRDPLTGVKSFHAYAEAEQSIDESIQNSTCVPFALLLCDVNDLKRINDTQGHTSGDALIREASAEICSIFAHSPVYRYGGDEFLVILRGQDFSNRTILLDRLEVENLNHVEYGGVSLSYGMAEYFPRRDSSVSSVFERADAAMRQNKKQQKEGTAVSPRHALPLANEQLMPAIEWVAEQIPGGFFIYRADETQKLLYVNSATLHIFGCRTLDEFKELTGYTFRGLVHPEDLDAVQTSIDEQIAANGIEKLDYVEYRIIRRDGSIRWVDDYGHLAHLPGYGAVYYVFIGDITEKHKIQEEGRRQANVYQGMLEQYNALADNSLTVFRTNLTTGIIEEARGYDLFDTDYPGGSIAESARVRAEAFLTPGARERYDEVFQLDKLIDRYYKGLGPATFVGYCRRQSGRQCFVKFSGSAVIDPITGDVIAFGVETEYNTERISEVLNEKVLAQQYDMVTYIVGDNYGVVIGDAASIRHGSIFPKQRDGIYSDYIRDQVIPTVVEEEGHTREELAYALSLEAIADNLAENEPYVVDVTCEVDSEIVNKRFTYYAVARQNKFYLLLKSDMTDVLREERERNELLANALREAEHANAAKTSFLSNMSHEIRTPMNAIIGLSSIALKDPALPKQTRVSLEKIDGSAKHLLGLINDILDMSRIESGRLTLRVEEFALPDVLDQITTMVQAQCRDKGLTFDCRVLGSVDRFFIGDDMKLKQVLINILSNAIKFTEAPGSVTFTVEQTARFGDNTTLRFIIKDTGIGIDSAFLPRIFEPFTQEDSGRSNRFGSTGLGMAITKNIVEMMNGTISVASKKGEGSEFTVTVPLRNGSTLAAYSAGLQPRDMRILVIDDDPIACEHAKLILEEVGLAADTCLGGSEALKLIELRHAKHEPYNLVLVDWKMPEQDGVAVTREIRTRYNDETTIIILTAYNWDDVIEEALDAGVDSFMSKPLFAANVLNEFEKVMQNKSLRTEQNTQHVELAGRHILLAEDMQINAEIMKEILRMKGMIPDHAENGKLAVELFERSAPGYYDAVLMDVRMPVMDGLEAAATIRALDRVDAKNVPIIALTANAFDEDVQRSLQMGMNAHLAKPVEMEHLYATLEALIGERP